jgi:methyl-accepting chemotaxis protein
MKLTLGKKLGLGFGVILALMVLSAVLTYSKASAIKETQTTITSMRTPTVDACKDLQRELNQTQSKGRQAILAGSDSARWADAKKAFDASWDEIGKIVARLDDLSPHWSLQANRDRLAEVKKQLPVLREIQETVMKKAAGDEHDAVAKAGNEYADKATVTAEAIKKPLGDLVDTITTLNKESIEEMNGQTRSMNLTMGITTFLALAVGIFVALFLSRKISGATQAVLVQAEAIADGDLTRDDLKIQSQDELGDLTTAINKMSGSLKRMILAITENSLHVSAASEELSSTSQQITANSEETSAQAKVVSNATQQVSQNLQTVATGRRRDGRQHQGDCQERQRSSQDRDLRRQGRRDYHGYGVETGRIFERDWTGY